MVPLIGIKNIISDFYLMLSGDANRFYQYFPFIILPLIVSLFLTFCVTFKITDTYLNPLLTAITILVGFLLNMILILYEISTKNQSDESIKNLLKKTYSTSIYSLTIGILVVTIIILVSLTDLYRKSEDIAFIFLQCLFSLLIYFLIFHFIVTLFMVLRRVHTLIRLSACWCSKSE